MNSTEVALKGVKIASSLLGIPQPDVLFCGYEVFSSKDISSSFNPNQYTINFNDYWMKSVDWIEIVVAAFHETRHAYQIYSVKNRINESNDVLNAWETEINGYVLPSLHSDKNDIAYLTQSIEIDAIIYTHEAIWDLFNVKTVIPDPLIKYIKNMEKDYII